MGLRKLFGGKAGPAERIETEMVAWGPEVWPGRYYEYADRADEIAESVRRLREALSADELRVGAADLLFEARRWLPRHTAHSTIKHAIVRVALELLVADPPADLVTLVRGRVEELRAPDQWRVTIPHHLPDHPFLSLTADNVPPHVGDLMELLERGAMSDPAAPALVADLALNGAGRGHPGRITWRYVLFLQRADALPYELFRQIALANASHGRMLAPGDIGRIMKTDDWPDHFSVRLRDELLAQTRLSDDEAKLLTLAELPAGHLVDAVRFHAAHELGALDLDRHILRLQAGACLNLARTGPPPDIDVVAALREYPQTSIQPFIPAVPASAAVLAQAVDWDDAIPLIEQLHAHHEVEASSNPTVGALDVPALRAAIDAAGTALTKKVFTTFQKAKHKPNLRKLMQACAGDHGEWIRKSLPKRNQLAVRAMAAAPLEGGFDEVKARYDWITTFRAETAQYGSQRQGSERGAADAALHNLATNAGYADVTRLRLAVAADDPMPIPHWQIGEYEVDIALSGARATTRFVKGDKVYKTAPKAVKESEHYDAIKAARKQVQAEAAQFAGMFETAMTLDDRFSPAEVTSLRAIPIAAEVLAGLVVHDAAGRTARLTDGGFVDTTGAPAELDGDVAVSHPLHLAEEDVLTAWQERLVTDRVVQPFKQAFRAHYALTPVELEDGFTSARFAGHVLDTGKASALFGAREWDLPRDEGGEVSKGFPGAGITAVWELEGVGHHLAELESVDTLGIFFVNGTTWYGVDRMPLAEVPPLLFSEVMRDADLLVSVAPGDPEGRARYRGGAGPTETPETLAVRRQLVTALVRGLAIDGVAVDGNHATVRGKLASYRVHLGSGAIHIDPGNHLCIVPSGWGTRKDLFLPFVDDTDRRISEIVSKIVFLTMDHKIKDETILSQIRYATG